ncbi:RPA family protein [Halomarina pelagica]|uniref:RPA family protein n=1 Tax=Halomarina pelagica TaxID=2961599 RepID=UPI0020C483DE|nr:hypothetical protein [Halomarina sp. BND7]
MSSAPGRREVAHRLFAAEFDDAEYSYSESDEERAPNYVVTPTGARVNRLFVAGVLTEVTQAGENILRARVVDPTGAFVVYAGQYQPEAMAFLDRAEPPAFVAVTGKARTFQPEDSAVVYTSVRPESVSEIDADTRDRWTVNAAERTLERVATFAAALDSGLSGSGLREALSDAGVDASLAAGIPIAMEQYGTTRGYLAALQDLALDAARLVADEVDEVGDLAVAPDEGGDEPFAPAVDVALDLDVEAVAPGTMATSTDAEEMERTAETESASEADPETTERTAADADAESEAAAEEREADVGDTEPEPEPEPESASPEPTPTGDAAEAESASAETESTADSEPAAESEDAAEGAAAEGEPTAEDELGDFDPGEFDPDDFELDEETRQEVEEEFGTEFSTGGEVEPAGEADIEPETPAAEPEGASEAEPEPEPTPESESESETEAEAEPTAGGEPELDSDRELAAEVSDEPAEEPEPTETPEASAGDEPAEAPAEDFDLEEVLLATMRELDDGDGAPRDELIGRVADATGAGGDEVEDAIQDALMSGQCYEPSDDRLKPI